MTLHLQLLGFHLCYLYRKTFFTRHVADILTESTSDQSTAVVKRPSDHKRYCPPQFKHPLQIAAARVVRDNPP